MIHLCPLSTCKKNSHPPSHALYLVIQLLSTAFIKKISLQAIAFTLNSHNATCVTIKGWWLSFYIGCRTGVDLADVKSLIF